MEQESQKQLYEVGYIINRSFAEEEVLNFHQIVKNDALALGAIMDDEGRTEKRYLSYPIKKQKEAYLAYFIFYMDKEKIKALETKLKERSEILRFLIIKTSRPPQRIISTRPFKLQNEEEKTQFGIVPKIKEQEIPATDIKEIDRKLEEILGK